jgi:hypothetical protein
MLLPSLARLSLTTSVPSQASSYIASLLTVFSNDTNPFKTDGFKAFISKVLKDEDANTVYNALIDYYDVGDDEVESYPINESLKIMHNLYFDHDNHHNNNISNKPYATVDGETKSIRPDEKLDGLTTKAIWEPFDVLCILCNTHTDLTMIGYGRSGVAFKWSNPQISSSTSYVFKITVRVPYKIKQYYKKDRDDDIFQLQREKVPLGSLEQYMQRMEWLAPDEIARKYRPNIVPVDNTAIRQPCTMIIMEFVEGIDSTDLAKINETAWPENPLPDNELWQILEQKKRIANDILLRAGVNHNDLGPTGNVLVLIERSQTGEVEMRVKLIDFGEAIPDKGAALLLL